MYLECELKETALAAWRLEHGDQVDAVFEDVWEHSHLKGDLKEAKEPRQVTEALAHVIRSPEAHKRVAGFKRLENQKKIMQKRFLAHGGTMSEFEKAWPDLKADLLKARTLGKPNQECVDFEARMSDYRRMF